MKAFLPWQATQWRMLQLARQRNRLAHALLLVGPARTGKRNFAEAFAQSLLCESPLADELACGACRSCLLVAAGSHSDLSYLQPEEPGKAIRIDAIREFTGSEALSSQSGGFKIHIIEPADAMNLAAANALLKTLEEPTPATLMILVSSRPGALPATIRSRCQNIAFPVPAAEQSLQWLAGQGDANWQGLLPVAAGAPLKALELAVDGMPQARQLILNDFFALLEGKADPVEMAANWQQRDSEQFLQWLASILLDIIRLAVKPDQGELFNPDVRDRLASATFGRSVAIWHTMLQNVLSVRQMLSRQLNLQLQLEALLIGIADTADPGQARGTH